MWMEQSAMNAETGPPPEQGEPIQAPVRRSGWKLYLLILLCVAPVIGSYLAYYVFPPADRTNYGTLVEPQRPVPAISTELVQAPAAASGEDGVRPDALANEGLAAMRGRWIMLAVDRGECAQACAEKLYFMRQTQASLGRERSRVQRVLLVTDATPLPQRIREAHPDLVVLRASPAALDALLPVEADTALADHIYLVDPLHNLMMRFPKEPDPGRTRKDLQKLLKASRIG
jgi:hypothetical protein